MTFAEVESELAHIRYKPGWTFTAQDLGERVAVVLETSPLEDSRGITPPQPFRMTAYVPVDAEAYVPEVVWDLIQCMEKHEAGEWFRLGDFRPHDPHVLPDNRQCE